MTAATLIHLGFEVNTGEPVSVPLMHMAVTGQTQESGKTTTLEALVTRSGATALTFVTKRGEQSFAGGNRVQPYFRDRADWQFVDQLLEAQLREKNKFLRSWIIKICRTTKTLSDVQTEVKRELAAARKGGLSEGVYTQLDAYLDLIVPEIKRSKLAPSLDLRPGLNVMDVSAAATPMQMLFVQSAIDWVNEHASDTVVVVPEAWEFIPEGKGSPVKASAVGLVRKGGGIGNRIWVDSQDMAGVDKVILRGCAVWLIGVQREFNEIKRNLANIPKGIRRPTAADVALLRRGQFYACWEDHAIKAYVQPSWMENAVALRIATGELKNLPRAPKREATATKEAAVTETEARELRAENERLTKLVESLEARLNATSGSNAAPSSNGEASSPSVGVDYDEVKRRLIADAAKDPVLLKVITQRPELEVTVQRQVIEVGDTLRGWMGILISEGFFNNGATGSAAFAELKRRGKAVANPSVYREADKLAEMGFFTKEADGYRLVPGMKVNVVKAR